MNDKEKYTAYCATNPVPIFSQPWWLDAVCEPRLWNVALVERDGRIIASLPYEERKRMGLHLMRMPQLTQVLGPRLEYPANQKTATRLAFEKAVLVELVGKLPDCDLFSQRFHHSITNVLPLHWKGFVNDVRYTYLIPDLSDVEIVWNGFQDKTRADIRKAQRIVRVSSDPDIERFLSINEMSFRRQGLPLPYSPELVRRLDRICEEKSSRKMWFAHDDAGRVHAAVYLVWDQDSAYYLMGGGDPELRNSGATSLLIWEAIQFASSVTRVFDFEGSMLEPIERFVRSFGAEQVRYFHLLKMSKRMKVLWSMRDIGRAVAGSV